MRAIPESIDATTVGAIARRLDGIETSERVTIPWAIESGSRAWSFPSPDSDYDCRFLYVRGLGDYLSPWPRRDVIETPLTKVFDVNGWDLAKALRLLVKGNGTLTEWLRSPIVYRGDPVFRDEFLALAEQVTDRALLGRHYRHVGLHQFATGRISLKRFFYALRPAAVLHWLDAHPDRTVPPMELMAALEDGDAPRTCATPPPRHRNCARRSSNGWWSASSLRNPPSRCIDHTPKQAIRHTCRRSEQTTQHRVFRDSGRHRERRGSDRRR